MRQIRNRKNGFTIVELLIVIVVIAILAAIVVVAFSGIQDRAKASTVKSDLSQAARQLALQSTNDGEYPSGTGTPPETLTASEGTTFEYTSDGTSYCLSAVNDNQNFHITSSGILGEGACPGHTGGNEGIPGGGSTVVADGSVLQTITNANCPDARTRAVDARDSRSYWVQRMADGKCWMLTNLAYIGGGTNTYGDVKTLTNGHGRPRTYTTPSYFTPPGSNPTTEPANPSTSTNGTGQYGLLYNWCAAMGGQATAACAQATTPAPDTSISICPTGWRLPIRTSGSDSEFLALNAAINNGATTTSQGLRDVWLAQYGGYWALGYGDQGSYGFYWTSAQRTAYLAHDLMISNTSVGAAASPDKDFGFAIRCVAM